MLVASAIHSTWCSMSASSFHATDSGTPRWRSTLMVLTYGTTTYANNPSESDLKTCCGFDGVRVSIDSEQLLQEYE